MKLIYDFECEDGHRLEYVVESGTSTTTCDTCGKLALRKLSAPRCKLEGITGAFPGAYDAWARKQEQRARVEQKRNQS
jgi:hypothetical protein